MKRKKMPKITFIEFDGSIHEIDAPLGVSIRDTAMAAGIEGIVGSCGGYCSCGTCHGYIDEKWLDKLPPISSDEADLIEYGHDPKPNSRLCCQLPMTKELDGIIIRLPARQY